MNNPEANQPQEDFVFPQASNSQDNMPRRRSYLLNTMLLALSVGAAWLLAELAAGKVLSENTPVNFLVRHMDRDVDFVGYQSDRELFWEISPNGIFRLILENRPTTVGRANNHGLRCPDFPLAKSPGETRILFLGDSATFGLYLKDGESYPFLVEQILNQDKSRSVKAINAAVTGYSSHQALTYLKNHGLKFAPDIVCVCLGHNDCCVRYITDQECSRLLNKGHGSSNLLHMAKLAVARLKTGNRLWLKPEPVTRASPKEFMENLESICDLSNQAGAEVILMAAPGRFPPDPGDNIRQEFMTNPIVQAVAGEKGCLFIELKGLRAGGPYNNRHLFFDSYHPNKKGQWIIAKRVINAIIRSSLPGNNPR